MPRKLVVIIALFFSLFSLANSTAKGEEVSSGSEKLNISELILHHITDSYMWHITTINNRDISIPLPVIVRGKESGWHIFSSSKFGHGELQYNGFSISHSDKYSGKIVEIDQDGEEYRPLDLSITKNALSLMINSAILIFIILCVARWYKNKSADTANPKGFVAFIEMFIMEIVNGIIKPCVGKNYSRFTPYLLTVFFFIFINNVIGIIPFFPGGTNITGNIAITFVLASFTFIMVNVFGSKEYWKEILWPDVPVWLKVPIPIIPVIEIIGIIAKPFALMIRLFANILAGHSVVIGLTSIIFITVGLGTAINSGMTVLAVIMTIFIDFLELLVAYIQAYVFTILSAVFIGLAQVEPHKQHK